MTNKKFISELNEDKIPILEEFYSIQGEGFNTGKAAYFVRVGGCDLACRWCDSKESWKPEIHQFVKIRNILDRIKQTPADTIVVTGGEPLTYNFDNFCELMTEAGLALMIETSGAYPLSGKWDWICLSPKRQKPPKNDYFEKANELKVIVYENEDLLWAEECAKKVNKSCVLFLQPEWSKFAVTKNMVVDYVKNNPRWNVSIQTHKFLKIP
ncbi:MAG: 7-carboxy-7-deazaguanine synthase QueE [Bacteroidales bacterium]|jgi:organic radical activating enzyme|nr:7-carboxy-7-deazaguanine synthase QueE [Bacteroidales bacterium]